MMFNFLKSKKRKKIEMEEKERYIANKAISDAISESNCSKCNCKTCAKKE